MVRRSTPTNTAQMISNGLAIILTDLVIVLFAQKIWGTHHSAKAFYTLR